MNLHRSVLLVRQQIPRLSTAVTYNRDIGIYLTSSVTRRNSSSAGSQEHLHPLQVGNCDSNSRLVADEDDTDGSHKRLFTPGPLGVSMTTKQAMLRDLGSRDEEFIRIVRDIRNTLVDIADGSPDVHTCVPVQGSGTSAIEAVFSTVTPRDKKAKMLILANGAYGTRQVKMCDVMGIPYHVESFPENVSVCADRVRHLVTEEKYSLVSVVHCETSSGVLNPIEEIGNVVKATQPDCLYFVDAMSSLGGVPLSMRAAHIDYLVSSVNKCLEGTPGFSYVIADKNNLLQSKGNSHSLTLDLSDQYEALEKTGQFRFTPPTHVFLALKQALHEFDQEGGVAGRAKRYKENREILKHGMARLGFTEFLDDELQSHIITSYLFPSHSNFIFEEFYQRLSDKGSVIYPGKVLQADCFRIGTIGHIFPDDVKRLLVHIGDVCQDMAIPTPLEQSN